MNMESSKKYVDILVKITRTEYAQKLRSGYVYMNPLKYYRNIEGDASKQGGAFDSQEGLAAEHVNLDLKTSISKIHVSLKDIPIFFDYPVFCCTRLRFPVDTSAGVGTLNLDPRLKNDFAKGDQNEFSVLIIRTRDFKERFERTAKNQNIRHEIKPVVYADFDNDPKYFDNPSAVIFRKSLSFSYQKELRAVLYRWSSKPESFFIGDLSDISVLLSANVLTDGIKIYP